MRKFIKLFTGQKGFTLIELLVVIAILGVLAAVAVPNVLGLLNKGDESTIAANRAALQTAADTYATQNGGAYPDDLHSLTPTYLRSYPAIGNYTITNGTVTSSP